MAKIKLGTRPKSFKPIPVTFQMPDGDEGCIEVTYKYRTKTEFGQLIDRIFKDAGEARPADTEFSMEKLMEKTRDKNAEYLSESIDGWNLDEELNEDSLRQLADELPGAASAIMDKYRSAAMEGRLGN